MCGVVAHAFHGAVYVCTREDLCFCGNVMTSCKRKHLLCHRSPACYAPGDRFLAGNEKRSGGRYHAFFLIGGQSTDDRQLAIGPQRLYISGPRKGVQWPLLI